MGSRAIAGSLLVAAALALPGCTAEYAEAEAPIEGVAALASRSCSRATLRATDSFERAAAADATWSKGRVSDTLPLIKVPSAKSTAKVLASKVAASTDDEGTSTSYIEREVPTTGCIGAEFSVSYSESAPFPADAWTYFFWIDGSEDMNISLFRIGNVVRLAAQRGGTELSRVDVEVPPRRWTKIKIEVDLDSDRPTMAITADDNPTQNVTLAERLEPPYFVSVGTWSRGKVPAHEFWYDDLKLWY